MSRNPLLNLNGVSVKFIIFLKPSPRFIRIVCFHIVVSHLKPLLYHRMKCIASHASSSGRPGAFAPLVE